MSEKPVVLPEEGGLFGIEVAATYHCKHCYEELDTCDNCRGSLLEDFSHTSEVFCFPIPELDKWEQIRRSKGYYAHFCNKECCDDWVKEQEREFNVVV